LSIEKAREHLKKWNLDHRIMEFDVSCATVELAAQAVNCEPERIAKSMAFIAGDRCIIIVTAGDARVDNKKYKKKFNCKAKMVPPEELPKLVGHEMGGVCPFGLNEGVEVYLDISLKRFKTVFPACGSGNSAVELSIEELEKCSGYIEWVDVCKDWE
jgi:prolyl-tRNA editing enzyme YbaK/EbsC (Cys-tRNA(Pro) deacylase)